MTHDGRGAMPHGIQQWLVACEAPAPTPECACTPSGAEGLRRELGPLPLAWPSHEHLG
jgi:hypothetical protein